MERKIGETFEYEGKTLKVKEDKNGSCHDCFFNKKCTLPVIKIVGKCDADNREDGKSIIFVEVQEQPQETEEIKERQIGEVFDYEGKKLKVVIAEIRCGNCFFHNGRCCTRINRTTGECKSSKRTDNESVEITEEQAEQPQELNLCEILKDCPEGWEFHSSIHGKVRFDHLCPGYDFSVCVMQSDGYIVCYSSDGKYTKNPNSECCLFPSKDQRDWSKFTAPWLKKEKFDPKTLKPFDKVLSKYDGGCWSANLFSHIEEENNKYHGTCSFVCNGSLVKFCIPYNDETKHLVGTKEEAPEYYRYWED